MSSEKVRATNLNCSVVADVRHDGSEPCVDVLFGRPGAKGGRGQTPGSRDSSAPSLGDGYRLVLQGAHLTAQEMLAAFASHIRARNAAADSTLGADKPGPGTGDQR